MRPIINTLGKLFFGLKKRKLPRRVLPVRNQYHPRKVLLLKVGALGDILMTTPLIRKLAKAGYEVDYAVGKFSHKVLVGNPNINEIIAFDDTTIYGTKKSIWQNIKLINKIRKKKYDLIFVLDKSWMAGVYAWFCSVGKTLRIGFDRYGEGFPNNVNVPYTQEKHDSLYYLDLAKQLGIEYNPKSKKDWGIEVTLTKKEKDFAKHFFKKHKFGKNTLGVVVGGGKNPGQSFNLKIWSKERYAELIKKIPKKYKVLLLGGPSDQEESEFILEKLPKARQKNIVSAVGKTSIHESIALMQHCKKIICSDSGPLHMAAAVNPNIISIFGPTNPVVYAPLHKKSKVIWKEEKACYTIFGTHDTCKEGMIDKVSADDVLELLR